MVFPDDYRHMIYTLASSVSALKHISRNLNACRLMKLPYAQLVSVCI